MENLMYGSIHTHFEDMYDTANDLPSMVRQFSDLGAKKVALTGHGNMFALEDLKDICKSLKGKALIPEDFEIIPGVEIYFGDEAAHMILIAKDYEGYTQLCRVISDSAKNSKTARNAGEEQEYLTPIVTIENLQKNISGGHVFATSACVGGVFGRNLGLEEENIKKNYNKALGKVLEFTSPEAEALVEDWEKRTKDPMNKRPTKAEEEKAKKLAAKGDPELEEELKKRAENYEKTNKWKEEKKEGYEKAKKIIKKVGELKEKADLAKKAYDDYKDSFETRFDQAKELYGKFEQIFGKENFFFELQNHGLESEKNVYDNIIKLAYSVNNPNFIASNDVHIGDRKGSETWQSSVLKRRVEKFNRYKNIDVREDEEEYGIKTDDEIRGELHKIIVSDYDGHTPDEIISGSIDNIKNLLSSCKVVFPEISINGINFYPKYSDREVEQFKEEVEKGLKRRFPNGLPEGYRERADYEMGIIEKMGYCGYHLIVKDYLEYSHLLGYLRTDEEIENAPLTIPEMEKYLDDLGIARAGMGNGPGRGSAAGSLCCYALGIVDVDPIKHGLLFERFLNPSRQSMPDIDSDFKEDIRDKVYAYIENRYGSECVSKVCTKAYAYGKAACGIASRYLAREALDTALEKEDVSDALDELTRIIGKIQENITPYNYKKSDLEKAYKKPYSDANAGISKMIDEAILENGLNKTKVTDASKAVRIILNSPERYHYTEKQKEILELSCEIEGIPSTLSMHACACIISGKNLSEVIPLAWNNINRKMTTQCLYPQAEELGLLKMDLLGLKNLGVITRIMQALEEKHIPDKLRTTEGINEMLTDEKIFKDIFSTGRTKGVFQFESDGMAKMLRDFKPRSFEDIVILVAAYRPGPMDFIPEIIASKWHKEDPENHPAPERSIKINHPVLDAILAPTYGVPIYQEQVMKIFQDLAGYDLAGADNVRRYMSKKKTDKLEHERDFFIYGSEWVKEKSLEELRQLKASNADASVITAKENEISEIPMNIKGCVPNGICTAEEANEFFDQLIEFSKYAFNKSHALCYAQVAMYTAYQKEYFPDLFYKYSLSNEMRDGSSAISPIVKYREEMESFGIKLLPPDITKSKSDFIIEKDDTGTYIREGFGNIKGESYKDYRCTRPNVMNFIARNPEADVSAITTFAKLGFFEGIWDANTNDALIAEKNRVHGNIKYISDFVQENAPLLKELGLCKKEKGVDSPEYLSCIEKVKLVKKEDLEHRVPELSKEDQRLYRKIEEEKLGVCFSVEKDIEKLKSYSGENANQTFSKFNSARYSEKYSMFIPAILLSKTERKNPGRGPKYIFELMDKEGGRLTASSFDDIELEEYGVKDDRGLFCIQKNGRFNSIKKVLPLKAPIDMDKKPGDISDEYDGYEPEM